MIFWTLGLIENNADVNASACALFLLVKLGAMGHLLPMRSGYQYKFGGSGLEKPSDCFGGSLLRGNPKTKRPLASKLPIHLALRSHKSVLRLPKTFAHVDAITIATARRHGVRIYKAANVGNHIHLLIKLRNIESWAAFIRELTGRIAQEVLGRLPSGDSGDPSEKRAFWRFRPFTRIVRGWQKAFRSAKQYIELNRLEAEGFISRKETKTLKDLRLIWADG